MAKNWRARASRAVWGPALAAVLFLGGCGVLAGRDADLERLAATVHRPGAGELTVTFFDIVYGDSFLIRFPSGKTLLVDAGVGLRTGEILDYLKTAGITRLDGVLLTHSHYDHYGGMARIVERCSSGTFYWNGVPSRNPHFRRLLRVLDESGVPRRVLRRGDTLDDFREDGIEVTVLYPDAEAIASGGNRNHGSIVFCLAHGAVSFLFMGDAERREEGRLLALEGSALGNDVLKLGHHAAPGTGTQRFLAAVRPRVAVAQGDGLLNVPLFYPKPNYRIRSVLRAAGAALYTTGREGMIQLASDGKRLEVRGAERGPQAVELCLQPGPSNPGEL